MCECVLMLVTGRMQSACFLRCFASVGIIYAFVKQCVSSFPLPPGFFFFFFAAFCIVEQKQDQLCNGGYML